jgi:hypothetical protein
MSRKILVVDDNKAVRKSISLMLNQIRKPLEASSGEVMVPDRYFRWVCWPFPLVPFCVRWAKARKKERSLCSGIQEGVLS